MQCIPNVIVKAFYRPKEPLEGQYYFDWSPFDDVELSGWKCSLSGPGPNGVTLSSFLIDKDDPTVVEFLKQHTVQYLAGALYGAVVIEFPFLDVVSRCTY